MAVSSDDKSRELLACCRPDQDDLGDRKMRSALTHMKATPALRETFAAQARFDEQVAGLVHEFPLPAGFEDEIAAGLLRTSPSQICWRSLLRQPAPWAVLLAFAFLVAWGVFALCQRSSGFPGDDTITNLAEAAAADTGKAKFESLETECGKLGDTLFLKYGIDDYQVPPSLAALHTVGYRVFDLKDGSITQVQVREHGLTFFVFPADQQGVDISPPGTWKYVSGDQWSAAAEVHDNICFVAMCRGTDDQLADYLAPPRKPSLAAARKPGP